MYSDETQMIQRVVENFLRTGNASDAQVNVTSLPGNKTSYVEYVEQDSRSIFLDEYKVNGKTVWAGYSTRSQTVYLSLQTP